MTVETHLIVQSPGTWLVVPVVPDLNARQREDFVVIGPGWSGNIDELQWIVQRQKLSANLQDCCNIHRCDIQGRLLSIL